MVDQLSSFADEVTRVAREVGTEGKLGGQAQVRGVLGTWRDLTDNVNYMAANLTSQVRNIAQVTTAVAEGRPLAEDHRRHEGRGRRAGADHQHDGRPAVVVRRRGDARCPRGGHRGPARRAGAGQGRVRHLARPHRQRQLHGGEPDRAGPQHRLRRDRRGPGRSRPEDHGRRAGRDPRTQEHREHDGRPALFLRRRGDPCRPRGRHRGQARRAGAGQGRVRYVARPHRLGELHGVQPDQPGPQHRARHDGRGQGRSLAEDHRRRPGRNPRPEEHGQHDGRPAVRVRGRGHPRRPRGRHRRQARRPGRGRRRQRHVAPPHRERQPARRQPDDAGARDRRGLHRGDAR